MRILLCASLVVLGNSLQSRPVSPDIICQFVSRNVENKGMNDDLVTLLNDDLDDLDDYLDDIMT